MSDYRIVHSDELYHYGVKGMRWGVRRATKISNKQQDRRAKYLNKTQKKISKNQAKVKEAQAELRDIKKKGTNHEKVIERARNNSDWDAAIKGISSDFGKEIHWMGKGSEFRDQAYKEIVSEHSQSIKKGKEQIKRWEAANDAVMNMPIDSSNREYRKKIKTAKKYAAV